MNQDQSKMHSAIETYYSRQNRQKHPEGVFDNAGRWFPSKMEKCDCCYGLRLPSRAYPYSLMVHCRTITHISNLFDVDPAEMRKHIRNFNLIKKEVSEESVAA